MRVNLVQWAAVTRLSEHRTSGRPFAHKPGSCARESRAVWERQISDGEEGEGGGEGRISAPVGPPPPESSLAEERKVGGHAKGWLG